LGNEGCVFGGSLPLPILIIEANLELEADPPAPANPRRKETILVVALIEKIICAPE
jgi:hypothetical protein